MKALTVQEIDRLLADVSDARLRAAILLGFRHGLRASEICGLRWADVDIAGKTIICRRLKNSLTTTQPLSMPEIDALQTLLECRGASEWVFPSHRAGAGGKGRHVSRVTLHRLFKAACLLVGIPKDKAHCHALKHATCMALLRGGMELVRLKTYVGHKSIHSTLQYLQVTQEEASAAALQAFESLPKQSLASGNAEKSRLESL